MPTDLAQALIERARSVGVTPGELITAIIRADLNDEPFDPDQIRKDRTRQLFFLVQAAPNQVSTERSVCIRNDSIFMLHEETTAGHISEKEPQATEREITLGDLFTVNKTRTNSDDRSIHKLQHSKRKPV